MQSRERSHSQPAVLIVEDQQLLAWALDLLLQSHGWQVLGPANDVRSALDVLARATPDAAILDVELGRGETSAPIAAELESRNVPYVLASSHDGRALAGTTLAAAVNVGKPLDERRLLKELCRLTGPPDKGG